MGPKYKEAMEHLAKAVELFNSFHPTEEQALKGVEKVTGGASKAIAKSNADKEYSLKVELNKISIDSIKQKLLQIAERYEGDKTKVMSFLEKYNAKKVSEVPPDKLLSLNSDIDKFLNDPDELGF